MTKVLLIAINAKYIHSNPAVYNLKAYARKTGNAFVEIAEYTINNRLESVLADIYKRKPDVIAFSCYIWNISMVEELAAELNKLLPDVPIWAGGPEVSYEPADVCARMPALTGIMVGEGEETFAELSDWYGGADDERIQGKREWNQKKKQLRDIRGLYLNNGDGTGAYTPERPPVRLDDIPFFYHAVTERMNGKPQKEITEKWEFDNRIVYYESSRGCPFGCSYCLSSLDKRVRLRSLDKVLPELQFFLDRRVPQVKFIDRTFNCNHGHAMAIWNYIQEHDNGVTNFHFEIAADLLSEEEIELLRSMRPGLVQLEIGVQSTNAKTLEAICRRTDLKRLQQNTKAVRRGGNIHQHLDLIAGLPYEDYASFARSFNDVYAMRPNQLQLGFLKVLKGSQMLAQAEEFGIIYTGHAPYEVLYSKWLPYEKLIVLKQVEEMVELYYNSGQFTHVLPVLEQAFATPFTMYEALAAFYDRNGYFTNQPARGYRYHLLLQFASEYDAGKEELYRELCTFDFYLRENAKSRPDFARDWKEHTALCPKQPDRQTHAEAFWYPVWETKPQADRGRLERPGIVLFDYRMRSPLDKSAAWRLL